MQSVLERARRFARTSATVLLTGESGTGKELLAALIHQHSPRRGEPFVRVNCAALSEELIESELFGHEAGAFTGAQNRRTGRLEESGTGTLLLDELGELPLTTQAKLLRVLEEREYQRVGDNKTQHFAGRVIAATNRDLLREIRRGGFRDDLYHRINVLSLHIPPLRERREDIPALVDHFVRNCPDRLDPPVRGVTHAVMQKLAAHPWPGNVRELKNTMHRLCVLATGELIDSADLPVLALLNCDSDDDTVRTPAVPSEFHSLTLAEIERTIILARLEEHEGNKNDAAAALGVTPRTLRNKVSEYRRLGYVA